MDLIIFIVALSVLVLVHELGHFLMAKWNGIRVEEFGLGLPPMIFGRRIGETIYSLNALPIGGFVRMYGEDPSFIEELGRKKGEKTGKNRSFLYKKPWQKLLVVVGGVAMNLVLAVVIFTVVYGVLGVPTETNQVKIVGVVEGSPADKSGLKEGMTVLTVGGVKIENPNQLTDEVAKFKGKEVELGIEEEGGNAYMRSVLVRENPPEGEGSMGVAISNVEMIKIKWWEFYKGIWAGFKEAYFWGKIIGGGVLSMVGGLFMGQVPSDVSGPIGIYQATSSIKQSQGMWALLHFFGVVSVNLAVINILPFPALDGGRIIFVIYEMIFKKRANQKLEIMVNNIGMLVLLTLIVAITAGDVLRIFKK